MPPLAPRWLFLGSFIHCKSLSELEYLHDSAVCVDEEGIIVAIERNCDRRHAEENIFPRLGWKATDVAVQATAKNQFFFPGFIDTHIHASQYPNAGLFGQTTLLDWLNTYTFPTEASLANLAKAKTVYTRCIQRTLANGTTTAAYFATIDVSATNLLADLCLAHGQRAFIGRCCMDTGSPDYYRDASSSSAVNATRATISHIASIDPTHTLVTPIITPRFAISCTSELLDGLGALQTETQLPVQTHISETTSEIARVQELFPNSESYTDVYDTHGLLSPKTILAHAVHLTEHEVTLIKSRECKISHCPASNSALTSGVAKVRWLLNHGLQVGLGTDVSGGYSVSILEACRQASIVSRHVAMDGDDEAKLSVEEVLFLGTRGGAQVVGMAEKLGAFKLSMLWDAQLIGLGEDVDVDANKIIPESQSDLDIFGWETWDEKIAKWLFNGGDRNTLAVWVQGRLVHKRMVPK